MAIYPIDYTSLTTMLASVRDGLDDAGILTTIHHDTSANLIVTTTRSSRVIRFVAASGNRFYVYYGTSYDTGDTINDSVTLQAVGAGTGVAGALIVTGDVFGLFEYRGGTACAGFICGNLDNPANTQIMWGWMNVQTAPLLHDATDRVQMEAAFYSRQIISTESKYYRSAIPCMTAGNLLMSQGVKGVYELHQSANYGVAYVVVGDDAVVPGGGCNGNATYMQNKSLLIPGGNSWTP